MKTINSRNILDATPVNVWKTLTDFESYPAWNPFIHHAEGVLRQGKRLTFHVTGADGGFREYRTIVRVFEWGRSLVLEGHPLPLGRLAAAEHVLMIRRSASGRATVYSQRHTFRGVGLALAWSFVGSRFASGIAAMTDELRKRVETPVPAAGSGERSVAGVPPPERREE